MNLKKWLGLAIACSALTLAACGGQKEAAEPAVNDDAATAPKTYTVAMNAEFAPFEFKGNDGTIEGFDVDLMNAIAKEMNFQVTYKDIPWDGLFASLNSGDIDAVMSAVTITPERKQTMDFTEPYFEVKQVILLPKGKTLTKLDELKDMTKVAVVTGNTGDFVAQKILGATNPKIARYERVALVVKEIENSGADAALSDSAVVRHYVKNNGSDKFTIIDSDEVDSEFYGMAVRQGDELKTLFNEGLTKIKANGEYDKIYSKYFASTN